MKTIRRSYILAAGEDKNIQYALAFAMLLKERLGDKSFIKNFSINKLRKFIGCSPVTAKKYIAVLTEMGIVSFDGKDEDVMVMHRLYSGTKHRNVRVDGLCFDSLKDAKRSLQSLIFMLRQAAKDYVKRLIRISNDPKPGENYRKARKFCKKYAWQNPDTAKYEYREWGFSFKRIAKYIGCCVSTAQHIIKYAVNKEWINLHKHFKQTFIYRVLYRCIDGFTFTTRNNAYNIYANSYSLNDEWENKLVVGMALY